jgi:hypothetical protein
MKPEKQAAANTSTNFKNVWRRRGKLFLQSLSYAHFKGDSVIGTNAANTIRLESSNSFLFFRKAA